MEAKTVARIRLAHLLVTGGIYFCATSFLMQFPRYILQIGGDAQDAGWLLALGLVPALLLAAPAGEWNRRHGGRWPALLGTALVAASNLLMLCVPVVGPALFGIRMLYAIGHTLMFATLFTQAALMTSDVVSRVKLIGWLAVVIQVGNAIGGTIGELALLSGVTVYWAGSAGLAMVAGVLGVFFPLRNEPPEQNGNASIKTNSAWPAEVWAVAAVGMAFAGLTQFMPTYVEHLGRSGQVAESFAAAWFITPALLVVALVRLAGGYFAARLLRSQVLLACHALLVLTMLLLPHITSLAEALLLSIAFGLSYGWLYPALNGLAFQHTSAEARGRVSGWLINAFEIGFRFSTVGLGALIVNFGYPAMFFGLAGAYIAVLIWGWCLDHRRRAGALVERTAWE